MPKQKKSATAQSTWSLPPLPHQRGGLPRSIPPSAIARSIWGPQPKVRPSRRTNPALLRPGKCPPLASPETTSHTKRVESSLHTKKSRTVIESKPHPRLQYPASFYLSNPRPLMPYSRRNAPEPPPRWWSKRYPIYMPITRDLDPYDLIGHLIRRLQILYGASMLTGRLLKMKSCKPKVETRKLNAEKVYKYYFPSNTDPSIVLLHPGKLVHSYTMVDFLRRDIETLFLFYIEGIRYHVYCNIQIKDTEHFLATHRQELADTVEYFSLSRRKGSCIFKFHKDLLQNTERAYAFAMASHPRLGKNSPPFLQNLPNHLYKHILSFLSYTDVSP